MDDYLQFPPPYNQRQVSASEPSDNCSTWGKFHDAAITINPCFNLYHITDGCPLLEDHVGAEYPFRPQAYFNRTDVKMALHAPLEKPAGYWFFRDSWFECSYVAIFRGGYDRKGYGAGPEGNNDRSPDPIQGVLPQVIEATNRVLISHGDWDAILLANGTLLSIQNMTWNGQLGFQSAPSEDFIVPIPEPRHYGGPQGVMGKKHFERGLMWVESYQTGHMQPQYQPRVALRHLEWVLGRIDEL